jgi:hypothetical protein
MDPGDNIVLIPETEVTGESAPNLTEKDMISVGHSTDMTDEKDSGDDFADSDLVDRTLDTGVVNVKYEPPDVDDNYSSEDSYISDCVDKTEIVDYGSDTEIDDGVSVIDRNDPISMKEETFSGVLNDDVSSSK